MSWLKDILDENRRVVESWPAWKRGAAMTRKECIAEVLGAIQSDAILDDGFHPAIAEQVLEEFARQVEREVWRKVTKKYCEKFHEYTNYPDSFGEWLTAQQQELT